MDTYSYISENGTVRQIEDLIAKAKNEEQDTEIQANRNAINALSASVEVQFNFRVRAMSPKYFEGANERAFLKNAVDYAIEQGTLSKQGQGVLIPGGWSGNSYGIELIQKISVQYYSVTFFGQEYILSGIYDVTSGLFPSLKKYSGQNI